MVSSAAMGKEQDLLVAVKNGDLLQAHKLLSKVKCNKTSEYEARSDRLCSGVYSYCFHLEMLLLLWLFFSFGITTVAGLAVDCKMRAR